MSNVLPKLRSDHLPQMAIRNPQLFSEILSVFGRHFGNNPPQHTYELNGELRVTVTLTNVVAAFCSAIMVIISKRAYKQMCRIYAGRVVAAVEDAKSIWNGALHKFPCFTVGKFLLGTANQAVSFWHSLPFPKPARFSYPNVTPESPSLVRIAFRRAEMHPRTCDPRRRLLVNLLANRTGNLHGTEYLYCQERSTCY